MPPVAGRKPGRAACGTRAWPNQRLLALCFRGGCSGPQGSPAYAFLSTKGKRSERGAPASPAGTWQLSPTTVNHKVTIRLGPKPGCRRAPSQPHLSSDGHWSPAEPEPGCLRQVGRGPEFISVVTSVHSQTPTWGKTSHHCPPLRKPRRLIGLLLSFAGIFYKDTARLYRTPAVRKLLQPALRETPAWRGEKQRRPHNSNSLRRTGVGAFYEACSVRV